MAVIGSCRAIDTSIAQRGPIVSVLVPVYNVEKYLEECLCSLLSQTLSNIEIICIDDGSTDSSPEILSRFAKNHEHCRVLTQVNRGYGAALNVGLDAAAGDYIGIVEPDDFVGPTMFESLLLAVLQNDCEVVKSNRYDLRGNERKFVEEYKQSECGVVFKPLSNPTFLFKAPCTTTGLYSKAFLDGYGIRYNETPGASYQDTAFAFKTSILADKMLLVHDAYYVYRRDNEASSVNSSRKVFAINKEYGLLKSYLCEYGIWDQVAPIYCACMYKSYMWSYNRIDWAYKYAFLLSFKEDFNKLNVDAVLNGELLNSDERKTLHAILKDPEDYFENHKGECPYVAVINKLAAENQILTDKYNRALQKIGAIKSSNSYRIGRATTYIPRLAKRVIRRMRQS